MLHMFNHKFIHKYSGACLYMFNLLSPVIYCGFRQVFVCSHDRTGLNFSNPTRNWSENKVSHSKLPLGKSCKHAFIFQSAVGQGRWKLGEGGGGGDRNLQPHLYPLPTNWFCLPPGKVPFSGITIKEKRYNRNLWRIQNPIFFSMRISFSGPKFCCWENSMGVDCTRKPTK